MDAISGGYRTQATGRTGGGNKPGGEITLQSLQKMYPELRLSAQAFSDSESLKNYAMKQSGLYNVALDPRAIERMNHDPEFAAKMHENLGGVKDMHDDAAKQIEARGAKILAMGTTVNKDGEVGMWVMTQTTSEGPKEMSQGKNAEDLKKRLEEKRLKRKEEEKRLEEKRKEKVKQEELLAEKIAESESVEVSASVESNVAPPPRLDVNA